MPEQERGSGRPAVAPAPSARALDALPSKAPALQLRAGSSCPGPARAAGTHLPGRFQPRELQGRCRDNLSPRNPRGPLSPQPRCRSRPRLCSRGPFAPSPSSPDHVGVELLVPGAVEGGGHVQPLAIPAELQPAGAAVHPAALRARRSGAVSGWHRAPSPVGTATEPQPQRSPEGCGDTGAAALTLTTKGSGWHLSSSSRHTATGPQRTMLPPTNTCERDGGAVAPGPAQGPGAAGPSAPASPVPPAGACSPWTACTGGRLRATSC